MCKTANLLLLAIQAGSSLQVWAGLVSSAWAGYSTENKKVHKQASKKISMNAGMSSIQAYKAHKQEGTIAATTLVSKVHKQGHSVHFPKHHYISGCMIIVGYANQFKVTQQIEETAWLLDMQCSH